jgi:glycosyltransferase involved in cell wall biosynthesis
MIDLPGARVTIVSYRLGAADGVSVTTAQWVRALRRLGARVRTVAGDGRAGVIVPGLAMDATRPPSAAQLSAALGDADLVVLDNICSLPVNRAAGEALAEHLAGRPAVLRHHDLPWERADYDGLRGWPPLDPAWLHVAISNLARHELAHRGIPAVTIHHGFAPPRRALRRGGVRRALGVGPDELLVLQPTRAIPRKNVATGMAVAAALDGIYWLTGPAEDGYQPELDRLLGAADQPVRRGLPAGADMAAAYAACDVVVLPSSWEGFGLPLIESALHRRPLAIGSFPVASEIAAFGFRWFDVADPAPLRRWLGDPDPTLLDHNEKIAQRHFGVAALSRRLAGLLSTEEKAIDAVA